MAVLPETVRIIDILECILKNCCLDLDRCLNIRIGSAHNHSLVQNVKITCQFSVTQKSSSIGLYYYSACIHYSPQFSLHYSSCSDACPPCVIIKDLVSYRVMISLAILGYSDIDIKMKPNTKYQI